MRSYFSVFNIVEYLKNISSGIYYTSMFRLQGWICSKIVYPDDVPTEQTNPEELFRAIMEDKPSFGRYTVFMVWLQRAFPHEGQRIWCYLKKEFPQWQYSFTYLLSNWIWYHVQKSLRL